jgi:hypothetical protein
MRSLFGLTAADMTRPLRFVAKRDTSGRVIPVHVREERTKTGKHYKNSGYSSGARKRRERKGDV